MTVAYSHPLTTPNKTDLYNALCAAVANYKTQDAWTWLSLSLPLPPLDLLAVLDLATDSQGYYWENPSSAEGLVAGGEVSHWRSPGGDRFAQAQQVADQWLSRTQSIGLGTTPDVRILCRFAFSDRYTPIQQGSRGDLEVPASLTLPQWQVSRCGSSYRFTVNLNIDALRPATIGPLCDRTWRQYRSVRQLALLPRIPLPQRQWAAHQKVPFPLATPAAPQRQQQFLASVEALLQAIERQQLTKVVLASALDIVPQSPVSVPAALRLLRQRYNGCHIFAVRSGGQTFLGASPERLFRVRRRRLSTSAIAGSAPRGATAAQDRRLGEALQRSEKEQHEHRIVADFIVGRLRQLGLQPAWIPRPEVLRLANIQHLHTPLTADVPDRVHPLQIVAGLHPTPAMAGLPQQAACEAIAHHEPFARSLYAAPLGWIDAQGDSEFIVGIRSALIEDVRIRLYAGAGIVQGSEPQREWAEVTMKLQAIASILALSEAIVPNLEPEVPLMGMVESGQL